MNPDGKVLRGALEEVLISDHDVPVETKSEKFQWVEKGICANPSCSSAGKKRRLNSEGLCRGCWRMREKDGEGEDGDGI